jgi:hypothetical protein
MVQTVNPWSLPLDLDLQRVASDAISHQLKSLDPIYQPRGRLRRQRSVGARSQDLAKVLAMIGGRDYA